jgi:N-acetylglucosamine kinase-like BadF-type ATPase
LLPQLAAAIRTTIADLGLAGVLVTIGTSGLTERENDPEALLASLPGLGIERIVLAHDSITSYLGALGYKNGVVCAAGTGSVTFAVGSTCVSRVDGWGNIMGDAGSGYWVGREALDAVMRAYDGRGPKTALRDVVQTRYPSLPDAYIELQADLDRVRTVASFAKSVTELAQEDEVARAICIRAGQEQAISAAAAARNVGIGATTPAICLIGSLFRSDFIRDACIASLKTSWPDFEPAKPLGDGLRGAQELAGIPAGSPIADKIKTAIALGR